MSTPDPSAGSTAQVPVCYRHPERETYIRCTRCERPICPDCMTSASVGFQCPECIAEGRESVRPVRGRLGSAVPTKPYVTYVLIAACVVVFGLQTVLGSDAIAQDYAMNPVYVTVGEQYYRLLTAMFLHYGILHIGFNMLVLWMLGPQIEYALGHVRFAVLYLVAGLGGSVASLYFSQPQVFAAGASGAIFGLMGAYLVVGRKLGADVRQVLVLIGINLVIGFIYPSTDWRAHLGGLVTGAVVAAVMAYAPSRGRVVAEVAGVIGVLAVLTLVVLVRSAELSALYRLVPA